VCILVYVVAVLAKSLDFHPSEETDRFDDLLERIFACKSEGSNDPTIQEP
jgi:hypothetical protein